MVTIEDDGEAVEEEAEDAEVEEEAAEGEEDAEGEGMEMVFQTAAIKCICNIFDRVGTKSFSFIENVFSFSVFGGGEVSFIIA